MLEGSVFFARVGGGGPGGDGRDQFLAQPGFGDEAEEAANLAATKDGWPKTIAFLKKNLGVK